MGIDDALNRRRNHIAACCFGSAVLSGALLVTLAFGAPGSVPARGAATYVPVGMGLILAGALGGGAYGLSSRRVRARGGGDVSGPSPEIRRKLAMQAKHSVRFTPAATDKIR